MRIAIIGGGSYLWSPGFCNQFACCEFAHDIELWLTDIDETALGLVGAAAALLSRKHGSSLQINTTPQLDDAIDGAAFVIVSIATGGLEAMARDVRIPERHGIWHTVGDTTGPGGWSRAVRNVPVFAHIGERMAALCPNAWMVNVSNPLTVLTRTPHRTHGIKAIGMCPGVHNHARTLAELAGFTDGQEVVYTATGMDHASFLTEVSVEGQDVLARLESLGYRRSDGVLPTEVDTLDPLAVTARSRAVFAIWRETGFMPGINDRHMVENFPWFLSRDSEDQIPFRLERTSHAERRSQRAAREQDIRRFVESDGAVGLENFGHGDDPVVTVVESLAGKREFVYCANSRNIGQTPQLPPDAVVETRARYNGAGVHPFPSPMPDALVPYLLPMALRQEAIIDIALNGSFDDLVGLVAGDPLCSRLGIADCRKMMRAMLEANREWIRNPKLLEF